MRENTMSEKLIIPKGYEVVRRGKLVCDMFFTSEVDGLGWEPYEGWEEQRHTIEWHTELIFIQPILEKNRNLLSCLSHREEQIVTLNGISLEKDKRIKELEATQAYQSLANKDQEIKELQSTKRDLKNTITKSRKKREELEGYNENLKLNLTSQSDTVEEQDVRIKGLEAQSGTRYSIDLQRAIEAHCRGEIVPADTAMLCPHHSGLLNAKVGRIKELEADLQESYKKTYASNYNELRKSEVRIKELEAHSEYWKGDSSHKECVITRQGERIKELEVNARHLSDNLHYSKETVNQQVDRIKELEGYIKDLDIKISRLHTERGKRQIRIKALEATEKKHHEYIDKLQQERDELNIEINDNHRRLKNQEREIRGHQEDFKKANPLHVLKEVDDRPQRGGWAPGAYLATCKECGDGYIGDKRSFICADCAYKEPSGGIEEHDLLTTKLPETISANVPPDLISQYINALIDKVAALERHRKDDRDSTVNLLQSCGAYQRQTESDFDIVRMELDKLIDKVADLELNVRTLEGWSAAEHMKAKVKAELAAR